MLLHALVLIDVLGVPDIISIKDTDEAVEVPFPCVSRILEAFPAVSKSGICRRMIGTGAESSEGWTYEAGWGGGPKERGGKEKVLCRLLRTPSKGVSTQ